MRGMLSSITIVGMLFLLPACPDGGTITDGDGNMNDNGTMNENMNGNDSDDMMDDDGDMMDDGAMNDNADDMMDDDAMNDNDNMNDNADDMMNDNDNMNDNGVDMMDDNANMNDNADDMMGGGDAVSGEALVSANCAACHGADGASGFAPNIQGESAAEITRHPVDGENGHTVFALSEQDVLDIEAFLGSF